MGPPAPAGPIVMSCGGGPPSSACSPIIPLLASFTSEESDGKRCFTGTQNSARLSYPFGSVLQDRTLETVSLLLFFCFRSCFAGYRLRSPATGHFRCCCRSTIIALVLWQKQKTQFHGTVHNLIGSKPVRQGSLLSHYTPNPIRLYLKRNFKSVASGN